MIDFIERHETYVRELLAGHPEKETLAELLVYHDKQISWVQQERLAHLITMMFVCLFFLLAAYILHYYRLENSVQRWYVLSNQIRGKLLQSK